MRGRIAVWEDSILNFLLNLFEGLKLRLRKFVPTAEGNREDYIGILLYIQGRSLRDVPGFQY
jgi:hypothetical protein